MDKSRIQAYLQSACSVLNFDIGEIWCCRDTNAGAEAAPPVPKQTSNLRFIELYTSPTYEKYRSKLVAPKQIPDERDVDKHHFSPLICEAVKEEGQVVWLHTRNDHGLLGRSDLPLRTAMGAPICSVGFDLCILVMFSPVVVELTEDAHRFLYTVAQAASEGSCGFMPASNTSPISNPALSNRPSTAEPTGGAHTRTLIEALGPSVVLRMVDMSAMPFSAGQEPTIKAEFMERVNMNLRGSGPPPLVPYGYPSQQSLPPLTEEDDPEFMGAMDSLPPLEDFLPPDLAGEDEIDWDFNAALEYVFTDGEKSSSSGPMGPGPVSGAEWFPQAAGGSGGGETIGGGLKPEGGEDGVSPIKFFYEDALQRLRFEEFVKGFLSMSVFHTSECWVARGSDSLEQVYCATCLADIQSWVQYSQSLHADTKHALPARIARENQSIWERDFDRFNSSTGMTRSGKGHVIKTAFGLPVPIDHQHRLIVIFYSQLAMEPAQLMESFVKRAMDFLWYKGQQPESEGGQAGGPYASFAPESDEPPPLLPPLESCSVGPYTDYPPPAVAGPASGYARSDTGSSTDSYVSSRGGAPAQVADRLPHHHQQDVYRSAAMAGAQQQPQHVSPHHHHPHYQQHVQPMAQHHHPHASSYATAAPMYGASDGYVGVAYAQHQPPQQLQQQHQQHMMDVKPAVMEMGPGMQVGQEGYAHAQAQQQPMHQHQQQQQHMAMAGHPPHQHVHMAPYAVVQHGQAIPHTHAPDGAVLPVHGHTHHAHPHAHMLPPSQPQAMLPHTHSVTSMVQQPAMHYQYHHSVPTYSTLPVPHTSAHMAHGYTHAHPALPPSTPMAVPMMGYSFGTQAQPQAHVHHGHAAHLMMPQPAPRTALPMSAPSPQSMPPPTVPGTPGYATAALSTSPPGYDPSAVYSTSPPNSHLPPAYPHANPGLQTAAGTMDSKLLNGLLMGRKVCKTEHCGLPTAKRSPYCTQHTGARHCQYPGCIKCAQGNTKYCIAHGGGRRCTYPGCTKGARDKNFCAAHGGGKRCCIEGCTKSAVGGSFMCTAHGGGRRCQYPDCTRSAQSSTNYCVRHGGGRKCQVDGCQKVARGRTSFCAAHGGGIRCKVEGCNKAAVGKFQMCRVHSGYPNKRSVEPVAATHYVENPTKKRALVVGEMEQLSVASVPMDVIRGMSGAGGGGSASAMEMGGGGSMLGGGVIDDDDDEDDEM